MIAANVLHAAADLAVALHHACRLLAPGGRLLLVEGTSVSARLDITFGLTDGWTRREDRELRPAHPLLDTASWQRLLRQAGLQDVVAVAELGGQAVLTGVAGPAAWVAVGRDRALADALGLPLIAPGATLPHGRLDGVVALSGLEAGDALADLLTLSRDLIERLDAPRLLVPVPEPQSPLQAALGGFLRTLAREHPALRPRSIGLADDADVAPLSVERALDDGEDRVAWRRGQRLLARLEHLPRSEPSPPDQYLAIDLTLTPMPCPIPRAGEVLIKVHAAGLNYKDALTAAGQVPPVGPGLGGECAGEIEAVGPGVTGLTAGDAVVAVAAGALATRVCADAKLVLPKPPSLDHARAAATPIAGVTAWHALHELAGIQAGQRVLVHAATGGVGWFAVRFAQQVGAEIVATAGSAEKRASLTALGIHEVYSSRDVAFAAARPVDIVVGALPEPQRQAALRLLRPGGCYVEIGRAGLPSAEAVAALRPDITWHVVALDQVAAPVFAALLRQVLDKVAADPTLLPPVRTLPLADTPDAFALMMRAAHVGKLVALPAHPIAIRHDGSYLVTGGLGGLGPQIAAWLSRQSAGGVVRLGPRAPAAADDIVLGDVTNPAALRAVDAHLKARRLPRLRGVIHAAGVLEDGVVASLDPGSFDRVAAPKLLGLRAIQAQWPDLELLVGFSSAGALFGSAGQAAHTAASAAFDAELAAMAAAGRPAVTVDWGAWRDHGAAAARGATASLGPGMGTIATSDGFAALDKVLQSGVSHATVLPINRIAMRKAGIEPPLLRVAGTTPEVITPPAAEYAPVEVPLADRRAWLQERVAAECAAMLAIRGTIEPRRPLNELGLDLLAALELRNRLGRLADAVLPASLLFDYPTVATLVDYLARTHFGLSAAAAEQQAEPDSDAHCRGCDRRGVGRRTRRSAVGFRRAARGRRGVNSPEHVADRRVKEQAVRLLQRMQAKLDAAEARLTAPIAIVGMACRLPLGDTPDAVWTALAEGRDAIDTVPPERWAAGAGALAHGGFLSDIDRFDAAFFGISPREAAAMDPQQRLILEVAWEALEHAGIACDRLDGTLGGVYLGCCTADYARLSDPDSAAADGYAATGGAPGVAAGRLAYTLGLNGPALVVDTACSSSLTAVHLAVQALRSGEVHARVGRWREPDATAAGRRYLGSPPYVVAKRTLPRVRRRGGRLRARRRLRRAGAEAAVGGCGVG